SNDHGLRIVSRGIPDAGEPPSDDTLRETITSIDEMTRLARDELRDLVDLVITAAKTLRPPRDAHAVCKGVQRMFNRIDCLANDVNVAAEDVGCNYKEKTTAA
ncbi:MAG: hypothetical protein ABUS47_06590, partial [Steroidobacter sp.]